VFRDGKLDVHHFDPYSQVLSKLERGFAHDLDDVRELIARAYADRRLLGELFRAIQPELYRYPAIDPREFARRVEREVLAPGSDGG
jgi:hypothetical protein